MTGITKNRKYYGALLITGVTIFGGRFLPPFGEITQYGMTIISIFAGVIFGYCTIGMILPSFMALLALGFSDWGNVPFVLQKALGNETVLYIISILLLSAMFEQSGLANKLVQWFVTLKVTRGKPWVISLMFMLAAYWAAWFVSAVPPTVICWALLEELFVKVGYQKGDKWPMVMMFGVLYAACLGAIVPTFQIGIAANYGLLNAISGGTWVCNPLNYMGWAFICSIILLMLFFLLAKYGIRPDVSPLLKENLLKDDKTPLTNEQKYASLIFIIFVLGLVLPSLLPEGNIIKNIFTVMGNCGWGLLMLLLAGLVRINGRNVFAFEILFAKGIMWDIVFMMATVFTLASALTEKAAGVSAFISKMILPLQQSMGSTAFIAVVSLLIIVLGNLTNTVAVSCIFIPVLYVIAQDMSLNMLLIVALINLVDNICLLSPSATVYAAMMYAKKDWLPTKWCLLLALFVMVTIYLAAMVVGLPLGQIFF